MFFRKANLSDLCAITEVYNYAYNHMRDEGNINQWSDYISFEKGVINYINNDCFYFIIYARYFIQFLT